MALVSLLVAFQPALAQNSMGYGQQQVPGMVNGQQYPAAMPSQPLMARTQLDQQYGNAQGQSPWMTVQQPPLTAAQQQALAKSEHKHKNKKGHPFLQKLENAAGSASSVAASTAGRAARVAVPMGMMMMMSRSMYGSGYGYSPSYMYSYLPYMGYRMLSPY
ncbi:MAG TPA: hypothetical protein V6D22_23990 [Candidatus Obscuribacterales bacterium]